MIGKRHLDLEGSYNIRDTGGYQTKDGRLTRWQTLLRSDSLHRLPPASQATLIDYGLHTIIDLRTTDSVRLLPDVFSESSLVTYYHQNMLGDGDLPYPDDLSAFGDFPNQVLTRYRIILDSCRPRICGTLDTLATPGALPALVHCSGGKDRTGIVTALVLGLAGVPADTIAEDYALSGRYLYSRYLDELGRGEAVAGIHTWQEYQKQYCPPFVMLGVLRHLGERYGGIEGYVLGGGLGPDKVEYLRSAFVE